MRAIRKRLPVASLEKIQLQSAAHWGPHVHVEARVVGVDCRYLTKPLSVGPVSKRGEESSASEARVGFQAVCLTLMPRRRL